MKLKTGEHIDNISAKMEHVLKYKRLGFWKDKKSGIIYEEIKRPDGEIVFKPMQKYETKI